MLGVAVLAVERKYGVVVITNGSRDRRIRDEVNRALHAHFIATAADPQADERP